MPKPATYPTLYDECLQISIAKLKQWKYLKAKHIVKGEMTWSRNGNPTGKIGFTLNTGDESPYIELDYTCNKVPINYRIQLVTQPSNLDKGVVWYFLCPRTGKQCRKLYLAETYFLHRTAFKDCYYDKQLRSKFYRELESSALGKAFKVEAIYEKLYKKHFKRQYAGKPTKRFQYLTKQLQMLDADE